MIIPKATSKQALFVIDVQPQTFEWDVAKEVTKKIRRFLDVCAYDAYVVVEYFADTGSMMFKQTDWAIGREEAWKTDAEILDWVKNKEDVLYVQKTNRSCFALENQEKILEFLKKNAIDEIHLVWFDINDCVLATLYGWLGCELYSYVLEELSHHFGWNEELRTSALNLFRHHHLTNNSLHPKIPYIDICFD